MLLNYLFVYLKKKSDAINDDCPKIVSRKRWGSQLAKSVDYQIVPVKNVIIHHTVTPGCNTTLSCSNILLGIQNYASRALDFDNIPFK